MSKIELTHIDKYYGKNHVLKDLNLTIEDGDFMTLLGPSGCGKTTTLRVVSGLEKPQNGIMTIDGVEMINADDAYYAEPSKRGLNLVFQSYALWPHMTVYNNIAFGLKIQKIDKAEIDRRVREVAAQLELEPYLKRKAFQHSQRPFRLGQGIDFFNQCRSYSFIRSYYIKCLHNFIPYTSFLYSVLIHT